MISFFANASGPAQLGPIQSLNGGVPRALFTGVRRPGRESDPSPPSRAEVKNAWSYTATPPTRLHGVTLG
jgi:hypothetical protein